MQKYIFTLVGLIISISSIFAQQLDSLPAETANIEKIKMLGVYRNDQIKLKWAPANFELWERYNKYGYILERSWNDTLGNGSLGYEKLSDLPIKPWSYQDFETNFKGPNRDDNVAVVGQCIYGETDKSQYKSWTDPIDDKQNRFMFTLLSCEFSALAAQAAALSYMDKDIKANHFYQYRLIGLGKTPDKCDTSYIYISTFIKDRIPQPIISISKIDDGHLIVGWDRAMHSQYFSGYFIERSVDGNLFTRINNKPYVNPESDLTRGSEHITWKDTSVVNYKDYHYRIVGLTSFAEESVPSKSVVLRTVDKTPPSQPSSVTAKHLGGNRVEITWNHTGNESDLAGFIIGRSSKANEGFTNVSGDKPIAKNKRVYIDENCNDKTTNFYIVAAVDTSGNASASLVSFAAILDSIPPSKPTGLTGKIDTNGVVTLTWPLGPESDIKGYLVHFANDKKHVFTCRTGRAVADTVWRDTISLITLTKKIYYRIQAVDVVDNISVYSDILQLQKPDIIPPVKPFIHNYKVEVGKIMLEYQPSTSSDVASHQFLRKKPNEATWTKLSKVNDTKSNVFYDETIEEASSYQYSLVAMDSTGNVSEQATTINLKTLKDLRNPLTNVSATIDTSSKMIYVNWNDIATKNYREIIIYKSENKGPVISQTRVPAMPGKKNEYKDKNIDPNKSYEYTTKVVYDKGVTSGFSPLIQAAFK